MDRHERHFDLRIYQVGGCKGIFIDIDIKIDSKLGERND